MLGYTFLQIHDNLFGRIFISLTFKILINCFFFLIVDLFRRNGTYLYIWLNWLIIVFPPDFLSKFAIFCQSRRLQFIGGLGAWLGGTVGCSVVCRIFFLILFGRILKWLHPSPLTSLQWMCLSLFLLKCFKIFSLNTAFNFKFLPVVSELIFR